MSIEPFCVLCRCVVEFHNHLFFGFSYSSEGWSYMPKKNGVDRLPMVLERERDWVWGNRAGNSCSHIVHKLSLAACIYGLWREKNCRILRRFLLQLCSCVQLPLAYRIQVACGWSQVSGFSLQGRCQSGPALKGFLVTKKKPKSIHLELYKNASEKILLSLIINPKNSIRYTGKCVKWRESFRYTQKKVSESCERIPRL